MKLLVGLGNPGSKYQNNRHNIGFLAIDQMAEKFGTDAKKSESQALTAKIQLKNENVLLAKPQTFMNNSGESVRALMDFYKIELVNLLVIHDELDLPFLALRFQSNRGHGGHNGIRSIHTHLNDSAYDRLKLGIGRPKHPGQDPAAHVLEDFSKDEFPELTAYLSKVVLALECYVLDGYQMAATKFNFTPKVGP